jgi:platelet-activating factor acetylhydrolase
LKTKEPERLLKLNVRAILQVIRNNGFEIAATGKRVLEEEEITKQPEQAKSTESEDASKYQDWRILAEDGDVRGWNCVSMESSEGKHVEEDYDTSEKEFDEGEFLTIDSDKP